MKREKKEYLVEREMRAGSDSERGDLEEKNSRLGIREFFFMGNVVVAVTAVCFAEVVKCFGFSSMARWVLCGSANCITFQNTTY